MILTGILISQKQQTPYFHDSTTAREWSRENMGFVIFLKKYKIGNNDFTTIWGSVNVKNVTPGTISSSKPTENVLGGSIGRTESPWTLNITPIVLTSSGDLILGSKNRFYHNSGCFWWWIPTRSGELRTKIHRIVTYVDEIRHFFDEVYSSCVAFVPDYQVSTYSTC